MFNKHVLDATIDLVRSRPLCFVESVAVIFSFQIERLKVLKTDPRCFGPYLTFCHYRMYLVCWISIPFLSIGRPFYV